MSALTHLNWGGVFPCAPDWRWDTATTPLRDFDLWAVFAGRGEMQTPDGPVSLAPGDCLVLRPGALYRCRTSAEEPLLVHVVHFDWVGGRGEAVAPPDGDLPALHRPLIDVTFFEALTTRAIDAHLANRPADADAWLKAALLELGRQDRAHAAATAATDEHAQRIEQVCAGIAGSPGQAWVVAELAASCFVTPDHFTRLFKAARGVTPREYILRHRIDLARRLLLSSSHSVGRIAELAGFSDIHHFSRVFKARTGRAPTRFRRGG
jgi:AraC-like DNA-binding protein